MKRYTQEEVEQMSREDFRRTTGLLRLRSKEWNAAWRELARLSGDADYTGLHQYEVWQYMGSDTWKGYWTHHFRHRNHARLGHYARIRVPASEGWSPAEETVRRKPRAAARSRRTQARRAS